MCEIILDNYVIDTPIVDILYEVKKQLHGKKLKDIVEKGDNIMVTCPSHKNGQENKPSLSIYCGSDPSKEVGIFHCFTCGEDGTLAKFISMCFDVDNEEFGKNWLIKHFGNLSEDSLLVLPELDLTKPKASYLQESDLSIYKDYHPYMEKRKITKEVAKKFKVKYDDVTKCIVFPVWDERNNLVFISKRSILNKRFYLPKDIEKPVYLLNFIDTAKPVIVCESQINTLTCWGYGLQAVGLFGTGSSYQYDILKKSGIRNYFLALDGDDAGNKGIKKFIQNTRQDAIVSVIILPRGKDVNDLSYEEFISLPIVDAHDYVGGNV